MNSPKKTVSVMGPLWYDPLPIKELESTTKIYIQEILDLKENELYDIELHSFRNILQILSIRIELLQSTSKNTHIFKHSMSMIDFIKKLLKEKHDIEHIFQAISISKVIKEDIDASCPFFNNYITPIREKFHNQLDALRDVQETLQLFIKNYSKKSIQKILSIFEIEENLHFVFNAIANNSLVHTTGKKQYWIVFKKEDQTERDYYIDLNLESIHENIFHIPYLFLEIIRDLLANARKYSNPWSHIQLYMRETVDHVYIRVCDEGIWILENEVHKIIHPGVQGSNRPDGKSGFWHGLTKAYFYTKKYGWNMTIRTKEHVGTCIEIILPIS